MAKRKNTKTTDTQEDTIQDITEIGMDVGDLKEVEVTDIESDLENASTTELIEEEVCDQKQDEVKDSKKKSEKQENNQDKTELIVEEESEVKLGEPEQTQNEEKVSTASEQSQKNVKSVKPSTSKRNPSVIQDKKPQPKPTPKINEDIHLNDEVEKKTVRSVRPSTISRDGNIRSSIGLFHR